MRRLLVLLIAVFIILDLVLAAYYFRVELGFDKVSIQSDSPDFTTSISNKEFLDKKLDSINFWTRNKLFIYEKGQLLLENSTIKRLVIHYTTEPQPLRQVNVDAKDRSMWQSMSMKFDRKNKAVHLIIYVNPSIIKTASQKDFNAGASSEILTALYFFTDNQPNGKDDRAENKFIDLSALKSYSFVDIVKK